MVRQNTQPMSYPRSNRVDNVARQTSGRAGVVTLIDQIPVLRGDSVGGQVNVSAILNHMPKPLLNSVVGNVQVWFVPKAAHPQFGGSYDDFMAAYQGVAIKQLGQADRTPPAIYRNFASGNMTDVEGSDHYKTLGVHVPSSASLALPNDDLFDAYSLIWNFRAAQLSNKIPARLYSRETGGLAVNTKFARAFWPQNRFSRVVADYEQALLTGQLELDVLAGRLPVSGIGARVNTEYALTKTSVDVKETGGGTTVYSHALDGDKGLMMTRVSGTTHADMVPEIFAEMADQTVVTSLQDIDKARDLQAMAKYRASMAGATRRDVYTNENAILAELMQGFSVPNDLYGRPWLLGSQMVNFGMVERHATDGASLEDSTTRGSINVTLPVNLPAQQTGGLILVTLEVLPERIYERQGDVSLVISAVSDLPNAERDRLRTEPVDQVYNWRVDAAHTTSGGLYGYEPMNDIWNREFTALGGAFYQDTPGSSDWSEARAAIWAPEIIDPAYTADHFLAPSPFPHDVFSDTNADAFECVVRRACVINGLTQIGDPLVEDNGDFGAVDA